MGPGTSSMHDPFRNAFVVEMRDLFPKYEVFQKGWAALAALERVLVVGNRVPWLVVSACAGVPAR